MNDVVIRTEQIGKLYEVGMRRGLLDLRECFSQAIRDPFKSRKPQATSAASSNVWAVRSATFVIRRGEIVGIMGHNGSGKTTLLKLLSRICEPTEGTAEIHGRIGTLLDVGAGLHGELTGRENIYLNAATHGMSRRETCNAFDAIVAFSELGRFIDRPLKYLSNGTCLRLAFSVAVFQHCSVLLVDEVLAQADPIFQTKCIEKITAAAAEGQVVVFVSHDLDCIRRFCTRGMVFENGHLVSDGPVEEAIACLTATPAVRSASESLANGDFVIAG